MSDKHRVHFSDLPTNPQPGPRVDYQALALRYEKALREINAMKPEPIGDTGFQQGPRVLLEAARRIALAALSEDGSHEGLGSVGSASRPPSRVSETDSDSPTGGK